MAAGCPERVPVQFLLWGGVSPTMGGAGWLAAIEHRRCAGPGRSPHRHAGGDAVAAGGGVLHPVGSPVISPSWPPRTPVAAAALLWEGHRLLLLRTTYKPTWTLLGGCVEEGESPLRACLREVEEEAGLVRATGTLRCIDHRRPHPAGAGGLRFIFDLGTLQPGEIQALQLPTEEIAESRLTTPDEAHHLLDTAQARRLATTLQSASAVAYLEEGLPHAPAAR